MAKAKKLSLRALVRGRVQGVGFRWFAQEQARRLGLSGWVRNISEGGVEVEAAGERKHLEEFLEALGRGPSSSHVEAVETEWLVLNGLGKGFEIRG